MTTGAIHFRDIADVLDELPATLSMVRRPRGLGLREAADQIGVGFNSLSRLERGRECYLGTAVAVLRWLNSVTPAGEAAWREMVHSTEVDRAKADHLNAAMQAIDHPYTHATAEEAADCVTCHPSSLPRRIEDGGEHG